MSKTMIDQYHELRQNAWSGKWGIRILSELQYLIELSKSLEGKYDALLEQEIRKLADFVQDHGAATKEICLSLEEDLAVMKEKAKSLTVLLIAHAHIDMNWMWGFQETAALTVSTAETMLALMREYPQFKFSQSQASVYRIIEEYAPYLLDEIRERVREGRWEVTASTWVENDKNMSGTEAMVRQILYTKKYLSGLLGVDPDSLNIDFEPDTFGHNENMPEILTQGGVKYYYHCRGYDQEHIYRWRSPSGAEVLVYREPVWYNDELSQYDALGFVPSFCKANKITKTMKFFGVGDHGGGPTRKEIRRWLEMQEWPLMPVITFGTLKEFFESLEEKREQFPVVDHELNYIFPGCYTSQARMKRANKMGEDRLAEAEVLDAMAKKLIPDYQPAGKLEKPWRRVLFNQFHDLLPGSGVLESYQHALGEFQKAAAVSQVNSNHALKAISQAIDTSFLDGGEGEDASLGAGVGFGGGDAAGYLAGFVGQSYEKNRVVTVVNPTQYSRREAVKLVLWDWDGDPALLSAWDSEGKEVSLQVIKTNVPYWAHQYHEAYMEAEVPAFGYATYLLKERNRKELDIVWEMFSTTGGRDPRLDRFTDAPVILENEKVRAVFDPVTMMLASLFDKEGQKELVKEKAGGFWMITESPVNEMTAWRIGPYQKEICLNETEKVKIVGRTDGELVQTVTYEMEFEASKLTAEVLLKKGSAVLETNVTVDWHELGCESKGIPQLNYRVPLGYEAKAYRCNIPGGMLDRSAYAQDVPCIGFMNAVGEKGSAVSVMSDCKYGFRGEKNSISLALLRSHFDPDPTPDQGEHHFRLGIGAVTDKEDAAEKYETFIHPVYSCSNSVHTGTLPPVGGLFSVTGDVKITALKCAEDGDGWVIRLQNQEKKETAARISLPEGISYGETEDFLERKGEALEIRDGVLSITLPPASIRTIRIK